MSTKPSYVYVRAEEIKPGDHIMLSNCAHRVTKTNRKRQKLIRIHVDGYHHSCLYRADHGVKTPVITQTRYELIGLKYVYPEEEQKPEIRVTLRNDEETREDVFLYQIYPGSNIEATFLRGETVFLTILKTGEREEIMS